MNNSNEITWSDAAWRDLSDGVVKEINRIRIAQRIFPTTLLKDNEDSVPDEIINFDTLSIKEGATKPFVELFVEFPLTGTQVKQEPDKKNCQTLAKMAAKDLALAEDTYFFQVSDPNAIRDPNQSLSAVDFPRNVKINNWRGPEKLDLGLLAEAKSAIDVWRTGSKNTTWGANTYNAVAVGIATLEKKAQAPPYALILPTEVYADANVAPSSDASLVFTADRIKPLVEGGYYSSGVLPSREGLLVALAGEPTKLFIGREISTEFERKEGANYIFRVSLRVQYVVRDPRALLVLKFKDRTKPRTLTSIAVTPCNASVPPEGTEQFTATGTYSDSSTQDITNQVSWSSSETGVATINASGLAKGVSAGETTITATMCGVSGYTTLTVSPRGGGAA